MTELNRSEDRSDQRTRAEENTDGRPVSTRPIASSLAEGLVGLPAASKAAGWENLLNSLNGDDNSENGRQ